MTSLSILIADDNLPALTLLSGILASLECHQVDKVRDGMAAMDCYQEKKHDLVFLDIAMPSLDGIAALRLIRMINPNAFVVMVSGENSVSNIQECLALGAQGFVVKPYSPSRIKDVLKKFEQTRQAG